MRYTQSLSIFKGLSMSDEKSLKLKRDYFEYTFQADSEITPVDLRLAIDNPNNVSLKFSAELVLGGELPANLTCSESGIITGYLEKNTATFLPYAILVVAQGENIDPLTFEIYLHVLPPKGEDVALGHEIDGASVPDFNLEAFDNYWKSFSEKLELPDLEKLLTRQITRNDIYYFINKFATLTVWNSDDFRPADNGKLIKILGASDHFMVYDFDVAIVASPKDLYSTSRTITDAVETARAMVQEAYQRNWNIELAGFEKMVSAAWVEAEWLNKKSADHKIEVKNFIPTPDDWSHLSHRIRMTK